MQVLINSTDSTRAVSNVSITQGIADHHHFEIRQNLEERVDSFKNILKTRTEELLGKEVKIDFEGNKFKGIVTSISLGRSNTGGSELIIKGSSPTASLDEGAYTRSFYEKTLKEIVSNATQDYSGSALDNKPKFSKKLKYIVQYREGNFKFLTRLAARFGEWLFYDGEKLYFGAKPSGGSPIELDFGRDLRSMDLSVKAVPVNLELQAYDYKKHKFIKKFIGFLSINRTDKFEVKKKSVSLDEFKELIKQA